MWHIEIALAVNEQPSKLRRWPSALISIDKWILSDRALEAFGRHKAQLAKSAAPFA
jgi:hypothetical protein